MILVINKKIVSVGVVTTSILLGVIAITTSFRLRQLADQNVAPNAPQSQPLAADYKQFACTERFSIAKSNCNQWCNNNTDCVDGLTCTLTDGVNGICGGNTCQ